MISSMDLFFRRDCAGGGGPAVDAPRVAFVPPALFDVVVVAACAVGCNVVDGAVDEAAAPNKFAVVAGAEDVVSVVAAGSFVELVVLGAALLRLEKILPPIGGEEIPEASFLALRGANKLGAVLGACEGSVETNESGLIRPSRLILTKGKK